MIYDSTGQPLRIGDRVACRGKEYTIKEFHPKQGRNGTCAIEFTQPFHLDEIPDEISVDLIQPTQG